MTAETILLDGPRVLVGLLACAATPLALRVAELPRLARAAVIAGALAAVSLWLADGLVATLAVAPYALVCALAGLVGLRRLLARWTEPAQLAMAAGLVALAGAAVWLVAHRAGIALLGYPPLWVLLTAAHFHVAGSFLALVVGWCAHGRGRLAAIVAIGCVLGVPLTAAGIAGPHWLELAGALVMAGSGAGAAIVIATTSHAHPAISMLRLAALPLAAGMVLATMYALRAHGTALVLGDLDPLASMVISHGVLDTAFALLALGGLFAIARSRGPARPDRAAPHEDVRRRWSSHSRVRDVPPLSRLRGGWQIGARFFADKDLERAPDPAPTGLVDRLDDLCAAPDVAPQVRAFYEHTGAHELIVRPSWQRGFRRGGRLWARIARRIGQLQLPVAAESGHDAIASRIVALDPAADGRAAPRAWIRTYPDGRALYAAAYATHRDADHAYMNIAFPVPAGQLSSLLRLVPRGRGVLVSTRLGGDCGIWLVVLGVAIRLPLTETIEVWTADDPDAPSELRAWAADYSTIARHQLWLCGIHYLTLDYAMRRTAAKNIERDA